MAKVVNSKKNSSKKTVTTKKVSKVDNDVVNEVVETKTEPQLVDEDNNIIYDPEEELSKLMESLEPKFDVKLSDVAIEGLEALKDLESFSKMFNNNANQEEMVNLANDKLASLENIATKLKNSIEKRTQNNKNYTSYWSGVNNGLF